MSQIRVLLVDDSNVFLNVEERWLSQDPRVQIVGRTDSGQKAVEHVSRLSPDLVLMDVTIEDMDGLETARKIKANPGAPRIVLVTIETNPALRTEAHAIKVDGYLAKSQMSTDLLPMIQKLFPES